MRCNNTHYKRKKKNIDVHAFFYNYLLESRTSMRLRKLLTMMKLKNVYYNIFKYVFWLYILSLLWEILHQCVSLCGYSINAIQNQFVTIEIFEWICGFSFRVKVTDLNFFFSQYYNFDLNLFIFKIIEMITF